MPGTVKMKLQGSHEGWDGGALIQSNPVNPSQDGRTRAEGARWAEDNPRTQLLLMMFLTSSSSSYASLTLLITSES